MQQEAKTYKDASLSNIVNTSFINYEVCITCKINKLPLFGHIRDKDIVHMKDCGRRHDQFCKISDNT